MSRCTVANFRRARRREAGWWRAARPAKKKPRIGGGALKFWESPNNDNRSLSTWCGHSMAVGETRTQTPPRFQVGERGDGLMIIARAAQRLVQHEQSIQPKTHTAYRELRCSPLTATKRGH